MLFCSHIKWNHSLEQTNESGAKLRLSKFWLTNACLVFVSAFIFELALASEEIYIKCRGMQVSGIYGLRMLETLSHPSSSCGQFAACSHGKMRWYHTLTDSLATDLKQLGWPPRQPPCSLLAFLVIKLCSLLHFILCIYAYLCVYKCRKDLS